MMKKFKYFKSKEKSPSFDDVIDCTEKDSDKILQLHINHQAPLPQLGLKPSNEWKVFSIKGCPGLIIIKNPFTSIGQRYYMKKLLKDYTKNHPNNLLESRFKQQVIKDFWTAWTKESDLQQKNLIKKSMRWTTLGYHYDWTNKIYNENYRNEFPSELDKLVAVFADVMNFKDFKSQAAIINFYHTGTTLSAHVDQSELCDAPLFSISFGQSAVFLIGGQSKDDDALPILLNSGDVVIMSDESRFCYHAVPRIFQSSEEPAWNQDENLTDCRDIDSDELSECLDTDKWNVFDTYLVESRINVNVRQFKK